MTQEVSVGNHLGDSDAGVVDVGDGDANSSTVHTRSAWEFKLWSPSNVHIDQHLTLIMSLKFTHLIHTLRSERLSCLQAFTSFLTALTNNDADGRIIVMPTAKTGIGKGTGTGMEVASLDVLEGTKAQGMVKSQRQSWKGGSGKEAAGNMANVSRAQTVGGTSLQQPHLKYILLNAASQFSKVRSC